MAMFSSKRSYLTTFSKKIKLAAHSQNQSQREKACAQRAIDIMGTWQTASVQQGRLALF